MYTGQVDKDRRARQLAGVYLSQLLMGTASAWLADAAGGNVFPARVRVSMNETDFLSELHYSERTILFADVVESVRLMQRDEEGAVKRILRLLVDVANAVVPSHGGRLVDERGDGLFIEFPDPRSAVACAMALHATAQSHNEGVASQEQVQLRIGIHHADVLTNDKSVFGHGVNLAARLTAFANSGETCASQAVADRLTDGLDAVLKDLGPCFLKHVASPVRVFRLAPTGADVGAQAGFAADMTDLRPTIAVLPFQPYDASPTAFCLGDVITDQVIAALSKGAAINVISRLSTAAFKSRTQPLSAVGQSLGAHFVATGRYWTSNGRVNALVELAEVASGRVIWTQALADAESAVLQIDSDFVSTLVSGISHKIFAVEMANARSASLPSLASHTLLLSAINLLYRLSARDFELARQALELLHERAPRHPGPLAWLARWHLFRVVQGWSDDRERDGMCALSFARRALDLDPDSSLALTMLGNVHTTYLKDLKAAESLYEKALAINPSESMAWLQKGNTLSFQGRGDEALAHVEKAVSLSPLDPSRHFYLSIMASAALSAGALERAMEAATSSLRLNADHVSTHRVLAIAQALSGRMDEARQTVRRILALEPDLTAAGFIARSPGAGSGLAKVFADALHSAGLPWDEAMQ